ncbi:MAG: hypothetical protein ACREQ9_21470, partial [Candidatus Binatia bacterium]
YGAQDPSAYRVRYGCEEVTGVPPGAPADHARDCPPNPQTENDRPVDGAYDAPEACPRGSGYTGRCVPANVVFANTGEDAMCIPIVLYWPLDRLIDAGGAPNEEAIDALASGHPEEVGTPGRVWKSPSDGGSCNDGASSDAPGVDDPNRLTARGRNCRAGL